MDLFIHTGCGGIVTVDVPSGVGKCDKCGKEHEAAVSYFPDLVVGNAVFTDEPGYKEVPNGQIRQRQNPAVSGNRKRSRH